MMDYEPIDWQPDPLWEEAETMADIELEDIADDLDDAAYEKAFRETTESIYKRLKQDMQEELSYLDTLTPEERQAYFDNDGRKPPEHHDIDENWHWE